MDILLVHNRYQQPGGEDAVVEAEAALLSSRGHRVIRYERHNDELAQASLANRLWFALGTTWSRETYRDLQKLIRDERPDVAHFHNTFPLISPAAYHACNALNVPVVQTVHNYRLLCPAATLMREQRPCEACVGRLPWPGVVHGCYRDSRAQTLVAATALSAHRALGTYDRHVQHYLALTNFVRSVLVRGGLPAHRIGVKPNFIADAPPFAEARGAYALYVGRLVPEKGVLLLLEAWQRRPGLPLHIVGDGPLRAEVEARARCLGNVHVLGRLGRAEVFAQLRDARMLVFPSLWYEGLGNTILEAFAAGVPVIASDLGAPLEVLEGGRLGTLFRSGDPESLFAALTCALDSTPQLRDKARTARAVFDARYTPAAGYDALMDAYQKAAAQLALDRRA
ncbi:MAG TPA: glycosyltransferase family 4 protein [Polyangiales bacterium]